MIYSIGYLIGSHDLREGVRLNDQNHQIIWPERRSDPFWISMLPLVTVGYLTFLRFLPLILNLTEGEENTKPKKPVQ